MVCVIIFSKQKTAYEMRISDGSAVVCSADLIAVNSVATVLSAASAFLTSGGNCAARIAPIAQKKLIETIARNNRRICIVELTICHEERKILWSMTRSRASASGGADGT